LIVKGLPPNVRYRSDGRQTPNTKKVIASENSGGEKSLDGIGDLAPSQESNDSSNESNKPSQDTDTNQEEG
jgi:hypothetical protein